MKARPPVTKSRTGCRMTVALDVVAFLFMSSLIASAKPGYVVHQAELCVIFVNEGRGNAKVIVCRAKKMLFLLFMHDVETRGRDVRLMEQAMIVAVSKMADIVLCSGMQGGRIPWSCPWCASPLVTFSDSGPSSLFDSCRYGN